MNNESIPSTTSLDSDVRCNLDKDQTTIKPRSALVGDEHFSNVTPTLPLLHGTMTLADALDEEDNVLFPLAYSRQREDFLFWIYEHREDFKALVSLHLGLANSETCRFGAFGEWKHGSFNVCIPIYIENWRKHPGKRVLLRLPLPYKVGESTCPGNANEKLRTEAAAFIWIRDNCPDISIPFLWGFGFPNGESFVRPESAPFSTRMIWYFRRAISSLSGSPLPCRYIICNRQSVIEHGYLIMDYIETTEAEMLSESWDELRHDRNLRTNFFKDLSHIMLALSQLPLPRIGSWTIDERGVLRLRNRPLAHHFHSLENEGIPTNIPRNLTYITADAYYTDLLGCHDSRIRNQPNSIIGEEDGTSQMANLFMMRGLLPYFMTRDLRHGPFVFTLTDLHRSNIFVDRNWHIKYIIDLEWACSLPLEMLAPPFWITNCGVDELIGEELQKFENACEEFMDIFEEKEKSFPPVYGSAVCRADIMRRGWKKGNFWYFHALKSPRGLYNLFVQHIHPIFEPRREIKWAQMVSAYWAPDAREVVAAKLEDKKKYEQQLRQLFKEAEHPEVNL